MTVVREVKDAVQVIADLVGQTRVILQAIKDGTAYLQKNFPDAQGDLSELLEEMRTTVVGLISASRVVPDFAFTVDGSDLDRQPARFNDHLVKSGKALSRLREDVSRLKGSCTNMIDIRNSLGERADNAPWWTVLGIPSKSQGTAQALQGAFSHLYDIDLEMTQQAEVVLNGTERALERVRAELLTGPGTSGMSVANVKDAARVLHDQAAVLRPQLRELEALRDDLSEEIRKLSARGSASHPR
jgi:hypothetical protein